MAAAAATVLLSGCAQMSAALGKQWIVVDFSPSATMTSALQARSACSHVQNAPPLPLPAKQTAATVLYGGVRFDTTNATPANVAELQTCLQRFPAVAGVDPEDTGDEGS